LLYLLTFQSGDLSAGTRRKLGIPKLWSLSVQALGRKLACSQLGAAPLISGRKPRLPCSLPAASQRWEGGEQQMEGASGAGCAWHGPGAEWVRGCGLPCSLGWQV